MSAALAAALGALVGVALLCWPRSTARRRLQRFASRDPMTASSESAPHVVPDRPTSVPPTALVMELVAAALDAGLPPVAAVEAAATACGLSAQTQLGHVTELWRLGAATDRAWQQADSRWRPLAHSLLLAERTGASAATVLRAGASDLRSERRRRARLGAQRLGVGLVLPLGLTALPAFLLWAVLPVVLGLAEQLLAGAA